VRPFFFSANLGITYPPCQWWGMEGRGMNSVEKDHNPKRHLSHKVQGKMETEYLFYTCSTKV
jgi:hypothetical protein